MVRPRAHKCAHRGDDCTGVGPWKLNAPGQPRYKQAVTFGWLCGSCWKQIKSGKGVKKRQSNTPEPDQEPEILEDEPEEVEAEEEKVLEDPVKAAASAAGRHRNRKGKDGERELVTVLKGMFPQARRGLQSQNQRGGASRMVPDVDDTPMWIECKRMAERIPWTPAYKRAVADCTEAHDHRPAVVMGRIDSGDWMLHMGLEDFLELIKTIRGMEQDQMVATVEDALRNMREVAA